MEVLAFIVRLLIRIFPWLSADYRRRIKPRQKCPACGAVKKHEIRFDPEQKLVVITCAICAARWGFDPVVKATAKWVKPVTEE